MTGKNVLTVTLVALAVGAGSYAREDLVPAELRDEIVQVQWEAWCSFCQGLLRSLETEGVEPAVHVVWRVGEGTAEFERTRLARFGEVRAWSDDDPEAKRSFARTVNKYCGEGMATAVPVAAIGDSNCRMGSVSIANLIAGDPGNGALPAAPAMPVVAD